MGTSSSRNAPKGGNWTAAKASTSRFVSQSGTGSFTAKNAISAYIHALGGAREAVRGTGGSKGQAVFSYATKAGQRLGAFLSGVAADGLDRTLTALGLEDLIGKSPHELISGLIDALVGAGGVLDEAVARVSLIETIGIIFDETREEYADLREDWNGKISEERIPEILKIFLIFLKDS